MQVLYIQNDKIGTIRADFCLLSILLRDSPLFHHFKPSSALPTNLMSVFASALMKAASSDIRRTI